MNGPAQKMIGLEVVHLKIQENLPIFVHLPFRFIELTDKSNPAGIFEILTIRSVRVFKLWTNVFE